MIEDAAHEEDVSGLCFPQEEVLSTCRQFDSVVRDAAQERAEGHPNGPVPPRAVAVQKVAAPEYGYAVRPKPLAAPKVASPVQRQAAAVPKAVAVRKSASPVPGRVAPVPPKETKETGVVSPTQKAPIPESQITRAETKE